MKRFVVVGFGFMGLTHTKNILENPDLELVAIADKNPEVIDKNIDELKGNFSTGTISPEKLSNIPRYASFDEMLRYEDFDAVFICVHVDLHYELARKALLCGKHVFLEKPFTLDIKQAEELISLSKKKETILMVGHVVRFMPAYRKLKEWIAGNEFGKLSFLSLSRFSGVPAWGEWKEKRVAFGSSGGALFDLMIHDIDFANSVLGQPGSINSNFLPGVLSKHDYISAMWSYYDKNITVKIEGGNIFHSAYPFIAGYNAIFEKATIVYSTEKPEVIEIANDEEIATVEIGVPNEGFSNEVNYFAQCLARNLQPFECMPDSSLQTIQLCYNHLS